MNQETRAQFHKELLELMVLYHEKILRQVKESFKDTFSPAQFFTLFAVVNAGSITMTRLAALSSMQKQQITKLVKYLVENGYVVRSHNQKDHRLIQVEPTEKGKQYIREYSQKNIREVGQKFEALSDEETREVMEAFATITRALRKIGK